MARSSVSDSGRETTPLQTKTFDRRTDPLSLDSKVREVSVKQKASQPASQPAKQSHRRHQESVCERASQVGRRKCQNLMDTSNYCAERYGFGYSRTSTLAHPAPLHTHAHAHSHAHPPPPRLPLLLSPTSNQRTPRPGGKPHSHPPSHVLPHHPIIPSSPKPKPPPCES